MLGYKTIGGKVYPHYRSCVKKNVAKTIKFWRRRGYRVRAQWLADERYRLWLKLI